MASRLLPVLITLLALMPAVALAAPPAPAPLVEGEDYVVIENGTPYAPLNGKVEVVEVFGYTCVHCAHFEPTLAAWKKTLPKHVRLTPVPAAFGGYWIPYARAFFAARQLGVQERTHQAVFDALHKTGALPIQNASADEIATFYASQGVDRAKFSAALRGEQVDQQLARAREWAAAAGVEGTPSIIVNGKYRVIGGRTYGDMLKIVDRLIARERPRK
ncbi:Thiol:disulfide interchange protein DsbA [Pseudoxanthomonas sp. CF385]|uniref:thiol:disulfide interchange protein DsbA/DsbL n=1 Tax=Pseudoxanthomonas sp. CF385 TaxID=1881042 RepID=UPI000887EC47|nr:thiol:disulfide interchange protein DsbA/DsbL [Pseudoxanthomonas sp. CF385]SDQ28919.1 Thiol:disulfide interchange protein DsbA [Pseudoxanthomonas sp. CF385]